MANPKPYYTKKLLKTLNNVNGSFDSCVFNIAIVVIKRGTALHPRSSKANQGRPKERKGCPCSDPGNCLWVLFSFLGGYQLSQSPMVSYAFLPHPSSSCEYKRRERAMLNIQHSPWVQPLLVVFMDAIDLLWLLVCVRLGIRVANPHIKECRALWIPKATRRNNNINNNNNNIDNN